MSTRDELTTYAENTWCPGCGNFGIFTAFKNAVKELQNKNIDKSKILITAGIGCHGKIFDYLNLSGFYSLHGRAVATAQGMKLGNPDLKIVAFVGDGDAMGEGLEHVIFAAKRNADITVIMHDNGVYGLTTGQFTPVSPKGFKGPSTPFGSIEEPLNPIRLLIDAGATFVARGYSAKIKELTEIFVEAILHKGFSFVDVLQPCVSFNDTYQLYNQRTFFVDHVATSEEEAINISKITERIPLGIFFKTEKPVYHELLLEGKNLFVDRFDKETRVNKIKEFLSI